MPKSNIQPSPLARLGRAALGAALMGSAFAPSVMADNRHSATPAAAPGHCSPLIAPPRPFEGVLPNLARRWRENIAELAATLADDPDAITAVVAASDGLCTAILLDNGPAAPNHLRAVLRRALHD